MAGLLRFVLLLLGLAIGPSATADDKTPLTLGVFPYVTPVQLVSLHTPLKDHLAKMRVPVKSATSSS